MVAESVNSGQKLLDVGEKGVYSSYTLKWALIKAAEPGCGKRLGRVGLGKESQMPEKIFKEISEHGIFHGITD